MLWKQFNPTVLVRREKRDFLQDRNGLNNNCNIGEKRTITCSKTFSNYHFKSSL